MKREGTAIHRATREDEVRVMHTIIEAFRTDPAVRWIFPDDAAYERSFPNMIRAMGGEAFALGTAHRTPDFAGVALWLPPGIGPDGDAIVSLIEERVPAKRRGEVLSMAEQMGRYHPEEPHWYLPFIAVHPARQGEGIGSALLRHALAKSDADGEFAYLESSSVTSIPLYERMGFEVAGAIQTPSSPRVTPMRRLPQAQMDAHAA